MNFNINLGELFRIAGMGNDKHKIDTAKEVETVNSIFANTSTNPIGDSVQFSQKAPKTSGAPFTTADMINSLVEQDPTINKEKLQSYMSKPLNSLPDSFEFDRPYDVNVMAKMAQDVDISKLNAYLDAAIATGAVERAEEFALEFEANGGDDKNAQMSYTIGTLYEIGALEEDTK